MFEDDIGHLVRKRVVVHVNGDFANGKPLDVAGHWDFDDLLNAASTRLNLVPTAKRIFNSDGSELDDVMMVENDEVLFVSSGPDFMCLSPAAPHSPLALDASSHSPWGAMDGLAGGGEFGALASPVARAGGSGTPQGRNGGAVAAGGGGTGAGAGGGIGGGGGVVVMGPGGSFDGEGDYIPAMIGGYQVGGFLGRGGFGEVRVGIHQVGGDQAALKFLPKSSLSNLGAAERMTTEIECLTALRHPNVIRLLQQLESPSHVVLVFELMKGGDLFHHLCERPGHKLSEEEARSVFNQVLSGVGHAHNHHICHRDLKLDNILLGDEGIAHVKVADFGLSDFYRPGESMRSNCGSLSYLAPEIFRGTSNAGPPLDVWSLGVILFAMLFGRLPFEGTDLTGKNRPREALIRNRICKCQYKMDESMVPDAKDLLRRMLKLDPNERASVPEIFNHCWLRHRGLGSTSMACLTHSASSSRTPSPQLSTTKGSTSPTPVSGPRSLMGEAGSLSTPAGSGGEVQRFWAETKDQSNTPRLGLEAKLSAKSEDRRASTPPGVVDRIQPDIKHNSSLFDEHRHHNSTRPQQQPAGSGSVRRSSIPRRIARAMENDMSSSAHAQDHSASTTPVL